MSPRKYVCHVMLPGEEVCGVMSRGRQVCHVPIIVDWVCEAISLDAQVYQIILPGIDGMLVP